MSWKSGSHDTPLSKDESLPRPWTMKASEFAARLPCVTMTPFGRDVLPEVNWRNARSSGSIATSSVPGDGAASSSTVMTVRSSGARASTGSTKGRVAVVVSSIDAPDALAMCATVS